MGQFEYGVGLAAKPEEMNRIALAFRAGEQKQIDRILSELSAISKNGHIHEAMFVIERIVRGTSV